MDICIKDGTEESTSQISCQENPFFPQKQTWPSKSNIGDESHRIKQVKIDNLSN